MSTVNLYITLPEEIARKLDSLVGPKSKSSFIEESIRLRIEQVERGKLNELLKEGYKNTKSEALALTKEFDPIDLEGWDEY